MAYGLKYTIIFKNRFQNDIYRVEILQKDFVGDVTELIGSETPFTASYQTGDTDILDPIKSCEFTISFITDGSIKIEDFYTEDDELFRVDYYFQSFADSTGTERRLYIGFLIQDGTSEPLTDRKHIITLKATDNLALLKNVKWNEVRPTDASYSYSLRDYIRYSLVFTGLYDYLAEDSMPLVLYGNVFENAMDDRSVDNTNDPYRQAHIFSGMFQDNEGQWNDCYTILTKILGSLNAELIQADGCWNVRRIPEYNYFTDGAIPGTQFTFETGPGEVVTAVTLDPLATIDRDGLELQPINEDQTKSILRPVRYVKNTFNYNQPVFIKQANLQLPAGATPFDTSTVGSVRTDKYDLATYFPDWIQRMGDTSYLQVETDTSLTPESEIVRFIHKPPDFDNKSGVQFNPISVSAGDAFDFTFNFRIEEEDQGFYLLFTLITDDGNAYELEKTTPTDPFRWEGPYSADDWYNLSIGLVHGNSLGTTEWTLFELSAYNDDMPVIIPASGMLLIQLDGNSSEILPDLPTGSGDFASEWKDITLTITQYINQSTQIAGQTHLDSGTDTVKAIQENDINVDDSPRITISGTLLTDEITSFDYTDTTTGEETGIGPVYFTKTKSWHRPNLTEALRLGNIITQERLELQYLPRTIIEGTFKNIRVDDSPRFISPLNLFRFGFIDGKSFTAASMELDYMADTFRAKLVDIFKSHEPLDEVVEMIAQKSAVSPLLDGMLEFDGITYYFGADDYITPSNTNSRFNYLNAFDTTIDLHETFSLVITGSGTVTFDLLKNGSIIDTQTLTSASPVQVIDFNLTGEAVTNGDYFECQVDTGGATVNLTSGTNTIIINGIIIPPTDFPYQFNYLYKTD